MNGLTDKEVVTNRYGTNVIKIGNKNRFFKLFNEILVMGIYSSILCIFSIYT